MIKLIFLSIFFSYAAVAGLPPTSTQGSAGGGYKTTFQFNFPYIPITQSGTNASFGQIPLASGVSGNLPLANMASIGTLTILSNITGGSAAPAANSLSSVIDAAACSIQGSILYRNGSGAWACLTPGTSGQYLQTQGSGANPQWASGGGGGGGGGPVYSANITNSGTPSITAQKGAWLSSLTHNNPGDVTLKVSGGIFSTAPICTCSAKAGFGRVCSPETGNTTTSVRIYTSTGGGTGTNYSFEVLCQ